MTNEEIFRKLGKLGAFRKPRKEDESNLLFIIIRRHYNLPGRIIKDTIKG